MAAATELAVAEWCQTKGAKVHAAALATKDGRQAPVPQLMACGQGRSGARRRAGGAGMVAAERLLAKGAEEHDITLAAKDVVFASELAAARAGRQGGERRPPCTGRGAHGGHCGDGHGALPLTGSGTAG